MTSSMPLGQRIKEARKALKLSQKAFGKTINVTAISVANWERGRGKPAARARKELMKAHGFVVDPTTPAAAALPETEKQPDPVTETKPADSEDKLLAATGGGHPKTTPPTVFELPRAGTEKIHKVTQEDYDNWTDLYPGVDISAELRKMKAWLQANPTRLKTNVPRFIVAWLNNAQDRPLKSQGSDNDRMLEKFDVSLDLIVDQLGDISAALIKLVDFITRPMPKD